MRLLTGYSVTDFISSIHIGNLLQLRAGDDVSHSAAAETLKMLKYKKSMG